MRFYLDVDLNLSLARRLQALGHDIVAPVDAGLEGAPEREILAHAASAGLIILTHNERHYAASPEARDVRLMLVPQMAQEDVPRLAEAIHRRAGAGFPPWERILCYGLRSGWSPLASAAPGDQPP